MNDIKGLIDICLTDSKYEEGRKQVKAETWEFCGNGAENVADYLMNKYNELTEKGN